MKKHLTLACLLIALSVNAQFVNTDSTATLVKRGNVYVLGDKYLTQKQVGTLYQQQCPEAYTKFRSARACTIAGATVVAMGGLEIVGVSAFYRALNSKKRAVAYSVGSIVTGIGLIVMLCAPLKYSKAVDIYNDKNIKVLSLSPYVSPSEVGIALNW